LQAAGDSLHLLSTGWLATSRQTPPVSLLPTPTRLGFCHGETKTSQKQHQIRSRRRLLGNPLSLGTSFFSSCVSKTMVVRHSPTPAFSDGLMPNVLSQNPVSKSKCQNKAYSVSFETTEYVKIGYTLNGRQVSSIFPVKIGSIFLFLDKYV